MNKRKIISIISQIISCIFSIIFAVIFDKYYFTGNLFLVIIILAVINIFIFVTSLLFFLISLKNKKDKLIFSGIILITWISISIIVPLTVTVRNFNEMVSYTQGKWIEIEDKYKYYMANDFLERYETVGMEKEDNIQYLGEPDSITIEDDGEYLRYYCGYPVRGGLPIDPYVLSFEIQQGTITSYSLQES